MSLEVNPDIFKSRDRFVCEVCGDAGFKTISDGTVVCEQHALPEVPTLTEAKRAGRNDRCPCGSGKKYKRCCGQTRSTSRPAVPYANLTAAYTEEQKAAHREFIRQWGFDPNPSQLMVFMEGDPEEMQATIVRALRALAQREGTDNSRFVDAVLRCNRLVTPLNQGLLTEDELLAWQAAMKGTDHEHGATD